jgi:hypothetical protein
MVERVTAAGFPWVEQLKGLGKPATEYNGTLKKTSIFWSADLIFSV